jgi:4-alpha-glucanotransferase
MHNTPLLPRASGVLLHVTALPGSYGIGDFGPAARQWVDWLAAAHQRYWQVLPLSPTHRHLSPYDSPASLALSAALISPSDIITLGLLKPENVQYPGQLSHKVLPAALKWKYSLLRETFRNYCLDPPRELANEFRAFQERHSDWLPDTALFLALRHTLGQPWFRWPLPLRQRDPEALKACRSRLAEAQHEQMFWQFLADRQWQALRQYAHQRGVYLIGDLPYYPAADSAEVWLNQALFDLEENGRPATVGGVAPRGHNRDGQYWGMPTYNWEKVAATGYALPRQRLLACYRNFDLTRLDHFLGYCRYFAIPFGLHPSRGQWRPGPGAALFDSPDLRDPAGQYPLLAEDVGAPTPGAARLRKQLDIPGTRTLVSAFRDGQPTSHHPTRVTKDMVAYTGTHDSDTVVGWCRKLPTSLRHRLAAELPDTPKPLHLRCIRFLYNSRATIAITPLQDLLGLGSASRFNRPGTTRGNWQWRFQWEDVPSDLAERFAAITKETRRG